MHKKRLIVIGGGAAGFFCAVNASRLNPALEVIILESSNKLLSKVKVSGGGRCNVTHACYSIADMIKKYPRGALFLKKAFHHFFTNDTIAWFSERGVALKTEADGRMFPVTDSSQTIIDCLLKEANKFKVEIRMNTGVKQLAVGSGQGDSEKQFQLQLADGTILQSDYVCIASGGFPKTVQYEWLKNTGHTIEVPVPSLFTFNLSAEAGDQITSLMGVTVENVQVKIAGSKLSEQGPLLITHWGFSGPAILKLSAWGARELAIGNWQFAIIVNWIPEFNENSLRESLQQLRFKLAAQKMANRNPFGLPNRLWEFLLKRSGIPEAMRWADLPAKEQNKLIKNLCAGEYAIKGKTTFKEEFVTAGGIQLNEIDHNTMQSKIHPGLFFAGEIINVDGITGGFNFQNAWTTGWIAAKGITES
ncbi:MAG: NAD(P)/FAD-dependent oxidoreductase [Chitinophagaceae bacterium]|nr:NAD(P)/FAD-dependent oxidoreductase [Chitinophagaceae bacterium]